MNLFYFLEKTEIEYKPRHNIRRQRICQNQIWLIERCFYKIPTEKSFLSRGKSKS